jgi:hypothetical protein
MHKDTHAYGACTVIIPQYILFFIEVYTSIQFLTRGFQKDPQKEMFFQPCDLMFLGGSSGDQYLGTQCVTRFIKGILTRDCASRKQTGGTQLPQILSEGNFLKTHSNF